MKRFSITLLASLFLCFACKDSSNVDPNKLAELERNVKQGLAGSDARSKKPVEDEIQNKTPKEASTDLNSIRLCKLLDKLPSNKATKPTLEIADSLRELLKTDIDKDCICKQETYYKKFGARIPIVKSFIRNKYRQGKDYLHTPMHKAAIGGSDTIISILIQNGFAANKWDSESKEPLELGYDKLKPRTVKKMIQAGANAENICMCGIYDFKKIDALIDAGLDSSGVDISGGFGSFMEDKNLDAYLAYKPDINKCPINFFFAGPRNDKVLRKLIKNGLRPFAKTEKWDTYVIRDLSKKHDINDQTLALLIKNVDEKNKELINEQDDMNGYTLLHLAAKHNKPIFAKALLELGADKEIINKKNQNALDLAGDNKEMIEILSN